MRESGRAGGDLTTPHVRRHPFLWGDGDCASLKPVLDACCTAVGVRVFILCVEILRACHTSSLGFSRCQPRAVVIGPVFLRWC